MCLTVTTCEAGLQACSAPTSSRKMLFGWIVHPKQLSFYQPEWKAVFGSKLH